MQNKKPLTILILVFLSLPGLLVGCNAPLATPTPAVPTSEPSTQPVTSINYRNTEYGFGLSLPTTWQGYSVKISQWDGTRPDNLQGQVVVEQGPLISSVHPNSAAQQPRQDIPIMVFTIEQWNQMQQDEWHIGAAPINPSELGRNNLYVFALPARYNYAFPEGWEEVEQILQSQTIQTFDPSVSP